MELDYTLEAFDSAKRQGNSAKIPGFNDPVTKRSVKKRADARRRKILLLSPSKKTSTQHNPISYEGMPVLSGRLDKKAHHRSIAGWQSRLFKTEHAFLNYYSTHGSSAKLLASIDLRQVASIGMAEGKGRETQFELEMEHRTYRLRAKSVEKAKDWVQGLCARQLVLWGVRDTSKERGINTRDQVSVFKDEAKAFLNNQTHSPWAYPMPKVKADPEDPKAAKLIDALYADNPNTLFIIARSPNLNVVAYNALFDDNDDNENDSSIREESSESRTSNAQDKTTRNSNSNNDDSNNISDGSRKRNQDERSKSSDSHNSNGHDDSDKHGRSDHHNTNDSTNDTTNDNTNDNTQKQQQRKRGTLRMQNPVEGYWLSIDPKSVERHRKEGRLEDRSKLKYIQSKLAFGIDCTPIPQSQLDDEKRVYAEGHDDDNPFSGFCQLERDINQPVFDAYLVACKTRKLRIYVDASGRPRALMEIGGHTCILNRIYVAVQMRMIGLPKFLFMELFGTCVKTGSKREEKGGEEDEKRARAREQNRQKRRAMRKLVM